ncbi:hypothetical protein C8R44DRAFT_744688 [Mycena epipterygia]|nr:hypothetical protein C8R44DRAFT_744688 [Mycena epipterygia]
MHSWIRRRDERSQGSILRADGWRLSITNTRASRRGLDGATAILFGKSIRAFMQDAVGNRAIRRGWCTPEDHHQHIFVEDLVALQSRSVIYWINIRFVLISIFLLEDPAHAIKLVGYRYLIMCLPRAGCHTAGIILRQLQFRYVLRRTSGSLEQRMGQPHASNPTFSPQVCPFPNSDVNAVTNEFSSVSESCANTSARHVPQNARQIEPALRPELAAAEDPWQPRSMNLGHEEQLIPHVQAILREGQELQFDSRCVNYYGGSRESTHTSELGFADAKRQSSKTG